MFCSQKSAAFFGQTTHPFIELIGAFNKSQRRLTTTKATVSSRLGFWPSFLITSRPMHLSRLLGA